MCNYTRLQHACTHEAYKLKSACPHSLNSLSGEPGTCGRMNITGRRSVISLCTSCAIIRDRQIGMATSKKVQNWMEGCRGAMEVGGDDWTHLGHDNTV